MKEDHEKINELIHQLGGKSLAFKTRLLVEKLRNKASQNLLNKMISFLVKEFKDFKSLIKGIKIPEEVKIKDRVLLEQPIEISWPKVLPIEFPPFPPFPEAIEIKKLPRDIEVKIREMKWASDLLVNILKTLQKINLRMYENFEVSIKNLPESELPAIKKLFEEYLKQNQLPDSFNVSVVNQGPKAAIPVRLSDGQSFYESLGQNFALVFENLKLTDPAITPVPFNITMTNADTEYEQALPAGTKKFTIQCRGAYDVRFAFVKGKVATPDQPYMTIKNGHNYYEENLKLEDKILYVACSTSGQVVEIICWT